MVTAIVPFTVAKSTAPANAQPTSVVDGSLNTFSNVQFDLTYTVYKGSGFVVSAKLNTALPTATYQSSTVLRSGEAALSVEPTALVGYSTSRFFICGDVGDGNRTNSYSSQTLGPVSSVIQFLLGDKTVYCR